MIKSTLIWFAPVPLVAASLFAALGASCSSPPTAAPTEADERAAILLAAKGVYEANKACAFEGERLRVAAAGDTAKLTQAKALVDKCSTVSHAAADALQAAEDALDARSATGDTKAKCALKAGLDAMAAIEAAGVKLPKVVDDARAVAQPFASLAGACQ